MITIVTPNLNSGKFLEENITSIMQLSIPHEHIIVDGGSTDNSFEIIKKYPHIVLLRQSSDTGMYGAIHEGFVRAKGDIFTWVNSDDRVIKEGFEKMYQQIKKNNTDIVYASGKFYFLNKNKYEFVPARLFGKFFLKLGFFPALQPSIIFKKDLYFNSGGFNFLNFRICGDFDLFFRFAKNSNTVFKRVPDAATIFLKYGESLGDKNHNLYLQEIELNKLPKVNIITRILFYLIKPISIIYAKLGI